MDDNAYRIRQFSSLFPTDQEEDFFNLSEQVGEKRNISKFLRKFHLVKVIFLVKKEFIEHLLVIFFFFFLSVNFDICGENITYLNFILYEMLDILNLNPQS